MDFETLLKLNEDKLNFYNSKLESGESTIQKEIEIHKKIQSLLENNPALFFQIPMEKALKILSKLVSDDELRKTYMDLTSPKKYEELRNSFKI